MVKHVILWKFKEDIPDSDKPAKAMDIKKGLEGLMGKIDGMTEVLVRVDKLPSSNADVMLDSTFVSVEALKAYQVNPEHVAVADNYVRPFMQTRLCMDYEV